MNHNEDILNAACGASQNMSHAERCMEKALCVLSAIPEGEYTGLLEVVDDYIRTGLCKYLAHADIGLSTVIGKIKASEGERCS